MWYSRLHGQKKDDVKNLIKNGQLELVQGGWVSTDEACPNYEDLIINMQVGHSFLQKEFGIQPTIGWNVGAYGHSAANAALFASFGFDAMFFSHTLKEENVLRGQN
jgi:hypothetical protein